MNANQNYNELRAFKKDFMPDSGVGLLLIGHSPGRIAYGDPVKLTARKPEDEGKYVAPTLQITTEMAQQLMDDLWQCGLRPSEGSGSAGQLAATQKHLEDMRSLVFQKAQLVLPEF